MYHNEALAEVREKTAQVLALDASDADPEAAHSYQDAAAEMALRWIVENTHDDFAHQIAEAALRAFDSGGKRW